jgi:hypothetical protein
LIFTFARGLIEVEGAIPPKAEFSGRDVMMYPFLYPDSLTYLLIKLCILLLVLVFWFAVTSAPAV